MGEQGKPRRIRRAAGLAAVMALTSSLAAQALDAGSLLAPVLSPVTGGVAGAPAALQVPNNGFAAFATGTVLHAGVAGVGATLDLVSSTAAATSGPNGSPVNSELGRVALPVLPAKGSYGQGTGLGVGVGLVPGLSAGLFGNAVATAPPSSAPVEQEAAPVTVAPIAHAAPLKARAQALSSAAGCVLGSNLAYGLGSAADVSLAGLTGLKGLSLGDRGAAAGQPVSRSESRTVVVPGSAPGRLGLMSETAQMLGPIALLTGTPNKMTVELKGQWVLRATADGAAGSVSYSPEGVPADQTLVAVRNSAGAVVAQATASQMKLAGSVGLRLDVPGVGEIVVGEQPRARGRAGAPLVSGTRTEAAVDLLRIRLLGQDVRIGHMEAAVAVPPAGITCPGLEVSVTPDVASVVPGADFGVKVKVRNPNDGTVAGLTVASRMAVDPGVTVDGGPASKDNVVPPNGPGFKLTTPLGPGQSIELPARVHVRPNSAPGRIRLGASATGRYGDGPLAVPTAGDLAVDGPFVKAPASPAAPGGPNVSVGTKGAATAASPTGSGGRKPARSSAGVSGAAGSAASAAPAAPAPANPAPAVTPAPTPVAEPATPSPAPPAPETSPGQATGTATTSGEEAAPQRRPGVRRLTDRRRWAWGGAAAIFLVAVAAAGVSRLLGGARR
jgi:hypothetical protein